jgi:rhamnosyltransferase
MAIGNIVNVGLVIPTLNAGARWQECLDALAGQTLPIHRRLLIDSASTDETVSLARKGGWEIRTIRRVDFNHGGTRQEALEVLSDCELVVFLTQDAIPAGSSALAALVAPFADPQVIVAYGRQLPHRQATAIEAHARVFNYGTESLRKDLSSVPDIGPKAFFCSNSFSAYRRQAVIELGGFRRDLILGEDAEFAARALLAGYAVFYCAAAAAFHSHAYGVRETFRRYFDTGVFHARNAWMLRKFGSHGGEGMRYLRSEIRYLRRRAPLSIPLALLQTLAKAAGYKLGRNERLIPRRIKRALSMTSRYWDTPSRSARMSPNGDGRA